MKVKKVRREDGARMDDFLARYLYSDEPLGCKVKRDDIPPPGKGLASIFAPQGLSRVVEDELGNIIGLCINDEPPQSFPNIYSFSKDDEKFQDLFDYLQEASGVTKVAPDAMELRMLAVCPTMRKRGVASMLVNESVAVAKAGGFSWVKMYCTSLYSSRMLAKRGWTLLHSETYSDLREKVPNLPLPDQPHVSVDLYIKATND